MREGQLNVLLFRWTDSSFDAERILIMEETTVYRLAYEAAKKALAETFPEDQTEVSIAPKFYQGMLLIRPKDPAMAPKEVPLDVFFKKIISVRNQLRVLEQKINASSKLDEAEKIDLQSYLTRCYGSLTTFNVLFKDQQDRFVGQKGEGE
jgi:hypothetical protein